MRIMGFIYKLIWNIKLQFKLYLFLKLYWQKLTFQEIKIVFWKMLYPDKMLDKQIQKRLKDIIKMTLIIINN